MTITWSPVSTWGAKIGLCLPRRMRATRAASRPRTWPSASTTYQSRVRSRARGENVRLAGEGMRVTPETLWGRGQDHDSSCPTALHPTGDQAIWSTWGRPEQPLGDVAALDHQLSEGLVEMAVLDRDLAVTGHGQERGLAQQLTDERRAHPLGPLDQPIEVGHLQGEAAAVQLQQPPSAGRIRQRHLDRQVDPAGAGGQGQLQQFGAVGG